LIRVHHRLTIMAELQSIAGPFPYTTPQRGGVLELQRYARESSSNLHAILPYNWVEEVAAARRLQ